MPYTFECDNCNGVITVQTRPKSMTQMQCGNTFCRANLWIRSSDWMKVETAEAFNPDKDKNKTGAQLWGAASRTYFSINMRFDATRPPKSRRYSLGHSYQHSLDKSMVGRVKAEKGGRESGKSVMGQSAHDLSGRGNPGADRQGEEWLHLWGDNLGGQSIKKNFVAGSYAANTEMLVIESMLAECIDFTQGLRIEVTAFCNRSDVAEYVLYEITSPYPEVNNFAYSIDCNNRYFTKQDYEVVRGNVEDWMMAYIGYWYLMHPNAK